MSTARVRVSVVQQQSVTPLWFANHETGDFSQWDGVWNSGQATNVISTEQKHGGTYSAKLCVVGADSVENKAGTRLTQQGRWNTVNGIRTLPVTAYYSVWYWFPRIIQRTGNNFNIFQWKQARADSSGRRQSTDPTYVININNRANGNMYLHMFKHVGSDGSYNTAGRGVVASASVDLPVQRWVHLECLYTWARSGTGQVRCWQDGVEQWNVTGVITEYDEPAYLNAFTFNKLPREWTVNNYTSGTNPSSHCHYVDDAAITTTRLGPGT